MRQREIAPRPRRLTPGAIDRNLAGEQETHRALTEREGEFEIFGPGFALVDEVRSDLVGGIRKERRGIHDR